MKKQSEHAVNILDLDQLTEVQTHFDVFDWTIPVPPPIPSQGNYVTEKQPRTQLELAKNLLKNTIDPTTPANTAQGALTVTRFFGENGTYDGKQFWGFVTSQIPGGGLEFHVNTTVKVDVNLVVKLVSPLMNNTTSPLLIINGVNFAGDKLNTPLVKYDETLRTITYKITAGHLESKAGTNSMYLLNNRQPYNLNIYSISLEFDDTIKVESEYYWKSVYAHELNEGNPEVSNEGSISEGVDTSTTETKSFAVAIGVKVAVEAPVKLVKVSAELSTTFTHTSTKSHTVSLSEAKTHTIKNKYVLPSGAKTYTFQLWHFLSRPFFLKPVGKCKL